MPPMHAAMPPWKRLASSARCRSSTHGRARHATAEARKHANASIRHDLDAHGNESLAVAQAAGKAADDIEKVQSELRTLQHDASELGMTIDRVSNKIIPTSKALPTEIMMAEMQLQPRLDKILAEANAVDTELAAAINMAGHCSACSGTRRQRSLWTPMRIYSMTT